MTLRNEDKRLPIHEVIKVIDSMNLYKTDRWWKIATLQESFGRKEVAVYLFLKREDKWVRKQKLTIRTLDEWRAIKNVVDRFMETGGMKNRATKAKASSLRKIRSEVPRRLPDAKEES